MLQNCHHCKHLESYRTFATMVRLADARKQIKQRESENFDDADIAAAFGDFDSVWNSLSPREQAQALSLLVNLSGKSPWASSRIWLCPIRGFAFRGRGESRFGEQGS